tara:strand:+ start:10927 stop:11904 length:978 start_codon:yes stop_codon:yes gene_type:complete
MDNKYIYFDTNKEDFTVLHNISTDYGGTGITEYNKGNLLYCNDNNFIDKLKISEDYNILQVKNNQIEWSDINNSSNTHNRILTEHVDNKFALFKFGMNYYKYNITNTCIFKNSFIETPGITIKLSLSNPISAGTPTYENFVLTTPDETITYNANFITPSTYTTTDEFDFNTSEIYIYCNELINSNLKLSYIPTILNNLKHSSNISIMKQSTIISKLPKDISSTIAISYALLNSDSKTIEVVFDDDITENILIGKLTNNNNIRIEIDNQYEDLDTITLKHNTNNTLEFNFSIEISVSSTTKIINGSNNVLSNIITNLPFDVIYHSM